MSKLLAFFGTATRRTAVFMSGFLLGFIFYESDSEIRHRLAQLMHDTGITSEALAILAPLVSEWFSQQHNQRLSNGA